MKILLVAAELAEVVAVGGVAEYTFGLAAALSRAGHEVRVALPAYGHLRRRKGVRTIRPRVVVRLGVGASEVTPVRQLDLDLGGEGPRLPVVLLGEHRHFASVRNAADVYAWPNHEPWIAFSRSVVDWLAVDEWKPDVVHCNDAHTAMVPLYLWHGRATHPLAGAPCATAVLTIHNLLDQGIGPQELLAYAGLPSDLFRTDVFEFYGGVSCFKAGLVAADRTSTVSETYARQICAGSEYGFGLEGVLRQLAEMDRLRGITNGILETRWRVEGLRYDGSDHIDTVDRIKTVRREPFLRRWEWPATGDPLVAFRARWDAQKGVGVLVEGIEEILDVCRVVAVSWGGPGATPELRRCWEVLEQLAAKRPERLRFNPPGLCRIEETEAHYAIADLLLMPSRYEPAGLAQMECQRYGAIPVVHRTGGLADTVAEEVTPRFPSPNGFVFDEQRAGQMVAAVRRAAAALRDPARRALLIGNALRQRNDWSARVGEYEALYRGE